MGHYDSTVSSLLGIIIFSDLSPYASNTIHYLVGNHKLNFFVGNNACD